MKRDFWGIDGEILGWNRYIISNFHSLHPPPQIQTVIYMILGGGPIACQEKIHHMMFKRKGEGSKAFWTMLKKTALFLRVGFPKEPWDIPREHNLRLLDRFDTFQRCKWVTASLTWCHRLFSNACFSSYHSGMLLLTTLPSSLYCGSYPLV